MTDGPDTGPDPWAAPPLADEDDPWTRPDAGSEEAPKQGPGAQPHGPAPGAQPPAAPPPPAPPPPAPGADPCTEPPPSPDLSPSWSRLPPARPAPDRRPRSINTGLPASMPASPPGWETGYPDLPPKAAHPASGSRSPGFAPADPAAVSGPPWPVLVARGAYTPPRLITWPIFAGCGLLAAYIIVAIALAANSNPSTGTASWVLHHDATISTLNADQAAIEADQGDSSKWITDWTKLRTDAEAAASLPNPGGAATAPWREMLNDYVTAVADVLQAEQTHNPNELQTAAQIVAAAATAAQNFDAAIGTS